MDKNNLAQAFIQCLEQEITWIKELNGLLSEEKDALATRKFEQLEQLADKKQILSQKLEESSKERVMVLAAPQGEQLSTYLQDFLKKCAKSETDTINKLNIELAEQLILCRELNTVNGQVIATNINSRQEVVKILSGNQTGDVKVYTATGDLSSSSGADSTHHQKA